MKKFFENLWNSKWGLSIAAGILLGLSFPPFPFPFLIILAFIFLFRLCTLSDSLREVAYVSYPGFVIWNVIVTYWLCMATFWGGAMAILANSVLMTIPLMVIKYLQDRVKNPYLLAIGVTSSWTTYEFLHHHWDLAWPWLSLVNAFSMIPWSIQYISFTGPLGASFWIVLISALVYYWIQKPDKIVVSILAAVIVIPVSLSLFEYHHTPITAKKKMQVLVVQPNYNSYLPLAGYGNAYTPLNKIIAYSDSMRTDSTDLILWPENAIQAGVTLYSPMTRLLSQKSQEWHTMIISGASLFYYYPPGQHPEVARKTSAGTYYNIFNAALGFGPNGKITYYNKAKLVPIVERVPFVDFLNRYNIFGLNWGNLAGYGRGRKVKDFNTGHGRITALVCYDQDFPDWVRQFVKKGSDIIAVITNDGWWGNSSGYFQHFEYARLRAIENRRYVVRSANNGVSAVIAPNGKVMKRTQYWTRTAFRYDVPEMTKMSFYTIHGDWFGYLVEIFVLLSLFIAVVSTKAFQAPSSNEMIQ